MRTSVEIALQDSASAQAQKIASGFDTVAQSADGINAALDPKMLEAYDRKLTQIGEKYSQLKNKEKSYNQQQLSMARQAQSIVGSAGAGVAQLGAGNVGGAAVSAGRGLTGLASLLGGPAALVAGIGLAGGVATNALADQYQQRAAPAGRIAGMTGAYGTDIRSNTMALRDAMESTTDAVAKYGKTFEEGAAAQANYLIAGGRNFGASQAAAYSMAYGADFSRMAAFEGLTGRYGQAGGLQSADWLRQRQGLSPAMLEEVMGGIQDTFSQALSMGVVRSMADISRSQDFFSGAGATWKGGIGAQRLQGLNQAVAGAAGLQGQSDLFLYRAAAGLSGGDLIETRKLMEQGMTPEMFKGLMSEFEQFGYGKTESILQLSKMFGLSTTAAEQMYNLKGQAPATGRAGGIAEGLGLTTEAKYTGDVERLKQGVAGGLGAKAFDLRASLFGGATNLMDLFSGIGGGGMPMDSIVTNKIITTGIESRDTAGAEYQRKIKGPLERSRGLTDHTAFNILESSLNEAITGGLGYGTIVATLGSKMSEFTSPGSGAGTFLSKSELNTLADLLRELIEATKGDFILEDNSGRETSSGTPAAHPSMAGYR